jgi:hypothetical protein
MINLLRKIRYQLLAESKFSRYLIYAIGEIVLVVIGILIALAVNDWNQDRKDQKLGNNLLVRVQQELVQDTASFRAIIAHNNELREEIKGMLVTLYEGVNSVEQVQHISAIYDQSLDQVFTPNDNTYNGMVSSGTLGLIRNPELKEKIVDLYSEYNQKKALLSAINQWMGGVAVTVDTETDFIKFSTAVSDIYTTPEMLNENDFSFLNNKEDRRFKIIVRAISATAFNQKARNAYYLELINRCDTVLQHIEQELILTSR